VTKRALIVDDSRLARHVLSKLLTEHGVAAEAAESAEAALEYLKGHRPDVIFLDHLMPGMDGFEALEAIKANPLTATIPVMMYTSKEGELYLGQARALGALGVLPKNVAPVEVTKVLRSLRLIPGGGDTEPKQPVQPPPGPPPLDARQLRELLAELFFEQGSALRGELRRELDRFSAAYAAAAAPPPPQPSPMEAVAPSVVGRPAAKHIPPRIYQTASALLLVVAAVFAYLYFRTSELLLESHDRTRALAAAVGDLSATNARPLTTAEPPAPGAGVLEVLAWGFNRGGEFAFGGVPLDAARADVLATLLDELRRINFAGTVALDVHVGRFCMNYGLGGDLELAPPDQSAATCEQIGWPELEAVAMGQEQSLDFAYTLANAERQSPAIGVQVFSRGSAEPLVPYPASGYETAAGDWNFIAARNQRVELRLLPNDAPER
jgi:CheY-like chemotaxis protein